MNATMTNNHLYFYCIISQSIQLNQYPIIILSNPQNTLILIQYNNLYTQQHSKRYTPPISLPFSHSVFPTPNPSPYPPLDSPRELSVILTYILFDPPINKYLFMNRYSDSHNLTHRHPISRPDTLSDLEDLKAEVAALRNQLEDQKRYRKSESLHLFEQIRNIESNINKQAPQPTRASITSSRTSIGSKAFLFEEADGLITEENELVENKLIKCLSENRLHLDSSTKTRNNIKEDFNLFMKQFSQFKSEIKLEVAGLRDNFSDLDFNVEQCLKTIGSPNNMKNLINTIINIEEKAGGLVTTCQTTTSEIELLKDQIDFLTNKIVTISQQFPEQVNRLERKSSSMAQQFENSQAELNDYISRKLNRMIESYNLNFEDVDKSINEIKEVLVDVVTINKIIKEKIGLRLSNTVDTQTFQKTIDVLNESFHTTYLINQNRAKEIHQTEYGIESEMHQIRNSLHYYNSGFEQNNSRVGYGQEYDQENAIQTLPIEQTSTLGTDDTNRFLKKNRITHNHFKKDGRYKTDGSEGSHQYKENNQKMTSLADQLRELETQ